MSERGKLLLMFAVALAAVPLLSAFYAVVAWSLWCWFVVPLGGPDLAYVHAFGLMLLFALLNAARVPHIPEGQHATRLGGQIVTALLVWGMGALLAGWMP